MNQSSRFEGTVRDLTYKGAGVVDHPSGRVFFVEGVWPGDSGVFEITKSDKRYGYARLIELKNQSKERVYAPCPHHGFLDSSCGGCPWMMASYSSQLSAKEKILKTQMARAQIEVLDTAFKPIISSPELGYRNRAQFKTDGQKIGFVSKGTKSIAAIDDCLVLTGQCRSALTAIKQKLPNKSWQPNSKFLWNFIDVNEQTTEANLRINHRLPFQQANSTANAFMLQWLKDKIMSLKSIDACIELFAGSGNFTEAMREVSQFPIVAAEIDGPAVEQIYSKKLKDVTGVAVDIYNSRAWAAIKSITKNPSLLVLDPPREGFEAIAQFAHEYTSLKHVIYISCDPSTLARDLRALCKDGFKVVELQPVDQFPQTSHLETLCLLSR
jgi:23S rRNA (uracil1939-C5)-methyltransferase